MGETRVDLLHLLEDLRDQHDADVGREPAVEEAQREAEGLL